MVELRPWTRELHYQETTHMNTQNNTRVQEHRDRMKANGYQRMEVTLGGGMIDRTREVARMRHWPLWRVVEEALDAYVMTDEATTGNGSRLAMGIRH